MDVGIGLPAAVPGIDGSTLVDWARRAEQRGFASLGVLDRIVYPNYDPLLALAAAAAVTDRVRLVTAILIAPLRPNTALLAKQALTLDSLSGGRLVLGVAIGGREDDYEGTGLSGERTGRRPDPQPPGGRAVLGGGEGGDARAGGPGAHGPGGPPRRG